jgi:uncharacterized protein
MKLVVLEGNFAVCRLPPSASPPAWVAQSEPFYSITRTPDELSVVCRHGVVPVEVDPQMQVESGWKALKVQGPLAFTMTGVLSSLASPLAAAEVSIFAVSTYDTDYLLVKATALERAMDVLRESGHEVIADLPASSGRNRPRDGPAVKFEPDPLVRRLVTDEEQRPLFSLCLVAGWPSMFGNIDDKLREAYNRFRDAVRQCWDSSDLQGDRKNPAAVYFYPASSLHVTVATLFRGGETVPEERQCELKRLWSELLERAAKDRLWPTKHFALRIDSAQIGARAGILLWNDESGGISAMRQCLRRAVSTMKAAAESSEIVQFLDLLDVPPIVHSTFLRFYESPQTDGATLQDRFAVRVLSQIRDYFPVRYKIALVALVCERSPYMHIPYDKLHVIETKFFTNTDCKRAMDRSPKKAQPAL